MRQRAATEETKARMSKASKGRIVSIETRVKLRKVNLGKKHSEETKLKMSELRIGDKSFNWRGGISKLPYSYEFTEQLKTQIRERDNYLCQVCSRESIITKLPIHHIDYDKLNSDPSNLVSTCNSCHSKTNYDREYWIQYFRNYEPIDKELI